MTATPAGRIHGPLLQVLLHLLASHFLQFRQHFAQFVTHGRFGVKLLAGAWMNEVQGLGMQEHPLEASGSQSVSKPPESVQNEAAARSQGEEKYNSFKQSGSSGSWGSREGSEASHAGGGGGWGGRSGGGGWSGGGRRR